MELTCTCLAYHSLCPSPRSTWENCQYFTSTCIFSDYLLLTLTNYKTEKGKTQMWLEHESTVFVSKYCCFLPCWIRGLLSFPVAAAAYQTDTKEVSIEIFIKLDTGLPYEPATPLLGKGLRESTSAPNRGIFISQWSRDGISLHAHRDEWIM